MKLRKAHLVALCSLAMAQTGCGSESPQANMTETTAVQKTTGAVATSNASFGVGGSDHPYEPVRSEVIEASFGPVRISEFAVWHPAHADAGLLAVTYLSRDGRELQVLREFPEAVRSGSNGQLGSWKIDNRFSNLPVIVTEGGGSWQGQSCLWTIITELQPSGPVELAAFEQSMATDGFPDGKPVDISGEIVSIERNRGFKVRFSGTRNFEANYVREGDKYQLQGGDDRALHGC